MRTDRSMYVVKAVLNMSGKYIVPECFTDYMEAKECFANICGCGDTYGEAWLEIVTVEYGDTAPKVTVVIRKSDYANPKNIDARLI